MSDIQELYTLDAEEEGVKLPVGPPGSDKVTGWIRIRGSGSQACRDAKAKARQKRFSKLSELRAKDASSEEIQQATEALTREAELDIISALVIDWSFDAPCTPDAIRELLTNAPKIADKIDMLSSEESLFFGLKRSDLEASSKTPSNSPEGKEKEEARSAHT